MRFRRGLVVGKFAPLHRGHQLLLDTALAACEELVVMIWSNPDFPEMPTPVRAGWLRALYPSAEVLAFDAPICPHNDASGDQQEDFVAAHLIRPVDAVFTSEDYGERLAARLRAEHVCVDRDRRRVPISGTRIRKDVHAHWELLAPVVRAHFVEKVAFLGAESTGKSTLVEALGETLGEPWVEEVGRRLWVEANGQLPLADYVRICREHVELEERATHEARRFVFVDTNAITTQSYAFFFFGECPEEVRAYARRCPERYAHTFVCAPDIPFDQDGTRVDPQVQRYQDGAIRNDLTIRGIPYTVVGGSIDARIETVRRVIGA